MTPSRTICVKEIQTTSTKVEKQVAFFEGRKWTNISRDSIKRIAIVTALGSLFLLFTLGMYDRGSQIEESTPRAYVHGSFSLLVGLINIVSVVVVGTIDSNTIIPFPGSYLDD